MSDIEDDHKDEEVFRKGQDTEASAIVSCLSRGEEKKKTRTRRDPSPDARGVPTQEDDNECDDDSGSDRDSTSEDKDEEERERRRRKGRRHKRRKERKASPLPPPPPIVVPLDNGRDGGGVWDFLLNLAAMTVFAIALSLYIMPGTVTPFLFTSPAAAGGPVQQAFHPEWPLHTFETAGKRKRPETKRAIHADSTLYKKVIETLSYHVLRETNKRVLCMWHLQTPVSIQVANVCVWKRRPPGVSIFSIGEPTVEEGMLLPMFNLEIKGYATNASKTVSESSITCGRSRLVARKRRPVVDIAFDTTTGKWTAVRLLVDEADETNAFALQQAWEEGRGYMCDHDY